MSGRILIELSTAHRGQEFINIILPQGECKKNNPKTNLKENKS